MLYVWKSFHYNGNSAEGSFESEMFKHIIQQINISTIFGNSKKKNTKIILKFQWQVEIRQYKKWQWDFG